MILAVLTKHCGLNLGQLDVYTASVGGARLTEPSVDLAVAVATLSAVSGLAAPTDLIAIGEVGLAGEVRKVSNLAARLREAERIGFRRAVVPAGSEGLDTFTGKMSIQAVHTIGEAMLCLDAPALAPRPVD
jgi:DNA repair protein RadA/Sms